MRQLPFLGEYLPYLLQRADHLLSRRFHAELRSADIDVSEWRVLAVLRDCSILPLNQLADIAMLPQPTTSHAVRRLEDDGLVSRVENDHDRRERLLALTIEGAALTEQLTRSAKATEQELLDSLEAADGDLAVRLRSLIDDLEARTTAS
ncbi:MAG: MarR family transcriptional regulator [Actinomycetota bacterium]